MVKLWAIASTGIQDAWLSQPLRRHGGGFIAAADAPAMRCRAVPAPALPPPLTGRYGGGRRPAAGAAGGVAPPHSCSGAGTAGFHDAAAIATAMRPHCGGRTPAAASAPRRLLTLVIGLYSMRRRGGRDPFKLGTGGELDLVVHVGAGWAMIADCVWRSPLRPATFPRSRNNVQKPILGP